MPLNVWYWIIMFLWLVVGLWSNYTAGQPYPWIRGGGNVLLFLLFLVIGIKVFGSPIDSGATVRDPRPIHIVRARSSVRAFRSASPGTEFLIRGVGHPRDRH